MTNAMRLFLCLMARIMRGWRRDGRCLVGDLSLTRTPLTRETDARERILLFLPKPNL